MGHQVQGQVFTGTLVTDVTAMGGKLFDLPPGEVARLRREKPGMDGVVSELETAAPTLPAAAAPYAEFVSHTATLAKIRAARVIADKISEVLVESEAKYEHDRENALGMIVDAVKSSAKRAGGKALLAAFEKSLAYVAQSGVKAAQTRKKNLAAKKAAASGNGNG
ncbi:MAG: hypothetical protein QM820_22625 [Minicystis sp.]